MRNRSVAPVRDAILARLRQGPMGTKEVPHPDASIRALRVHIHTLRKQGHKIRLCYILDED